MQSSEKSTMAWLLLLGVKVGNLATVPSEFLLFSLLFILVSLFLQQAVTKRRAFRIAQIRFA